MAFNDLLRQLGGIGRFQKAQVSLVILPMLLMASHNTLQNFTAAIPTHHCRPPAGANLSRDGELEAWLPQDRQGRPESCLHFTSPQRGLPFPNGTEANGTEPTEPTEPCTNGWIYDNSTFPSTIVTEWDLVCSHRALRQLAQSLYMVGVLLGAIVFGHLADRLGRRKVLILSHLQMAASGTCAAFAPSFPVYCAFRLLSGMSTSGIILNSMTLNMEWMPIHTRAYVSTLAGYVFSLGQFILAGAAYAVPHWRYLQLLVSAPFFVSFVYSWCLELERCQHLLAPQVLHRISPLVRLLREAGPHPEGPAESGPDQQEAGRGGQAKYGGPPVQSAEGADHGPRLHLGPGAAAPPRPAPPLPLPLRALVRHQLRLLRAGHGPARVWGEHLPHPGHLRSRGPACQVCGLRGHQPPGPATGPDSRPAAGGHLRPGQRGDTPGSVHGPNLPCCAGQGLPGCLLQLHLSIHWGAVPHNDPADRPGDGQHHGPRGQHCEPPGEHDIGALPLHASLHLRHCPRGRQRCRRPPAGDAGPSPAGHGARLGEQEERETAATAARAAEADGPAPGLGPREEWNLSTENGPYRAPQGAPGLQGLGHPHEEGAGAVTSLKGFCGQRLPWPVSSQRQQPLPISQLPAGR